AGSSAAVPAPATSSSPTTPGSPSRRSRPTRAVRSHFSGAATLILMAQPLSFPCRSTHSARQDRKCPFRLKAARGRGCWCGLRNVVPDGRTGRCPDLPCEFGGRSCQPHGVGAVGQRLLELPAGADFELGEDLAQVVLDGARADEQLGGDLRVGQAV